MDLRNATLQIGLQQGTLRLAARVPQCNWLWITAQWRCGAQKTRPRDLKTHVGVMDKAVIRIASAIVFLSLASPVKAQAAQNTAPTITSSTELVLVPAVVSDKSGTHLADLKKEEFVLRQDGKPQSIAVFEEVKTKAAPLRRSEAKPGTFSNFEPVDGGYHRLTIIVFDFVNTPFADQANARKELLKFLSDVAERGEPTCLFALTRDGLKVLQNFTDDPKVLAAALRHAPSNNAALVHDPMTEAGDFPGSAGLGFLERIVRANLEDEAKMASLVGKQAATITIQALRQIATAFRGLPGRKSLIWASSGFPFTVASASRQTCERCPHDAYDDLWRILNDAQIAVYSVDLRAASVSTAQNPGGVRPSDLGDPQFDTDTEAKLKREDSSSTLRLFAEQTGGKAFLGGGDLIQAFRQATQDDSSYYMIGYYVTRNSRPGWHAISLATTKKGARLRYRNGFLLSRDWSSPASARPDMQLAMSSPFDFVGIPVSVTWSGQEAGKSPGQTRVQFDVVMPPNFTSVDESDQNHMVVDIAAVARNPKGDVVKELYQRIDTHLKPDGLEQIRNNGMTYRSALLLPPGEYSVRFVVRDSIINRIGSVAAPVRVPQ